MSFLSQSVASSLKHGGRALCIFWARGTCHPEEYRFHDFGIKNGIEFYNFGIKSGIHFCDFGIKKPDMNVKTCYYTKLCTQNKILDQEMQNLKQQKFILSLISTVKSLMNSNSPYCHNFKIKTDVNVKIRYHTKLCTQNEILDSEMQNLK